MKKSFFDNLEFRVGFATAILFLGVAILGQRFMIKQERAALETRLGEKAAFINSFYSFLIGDALQRKDDVTLLEVINRLEQDQEIVTVVVVDGKSEIRYHADPEQVGTELKDEMVTKAMQTGDGILIQGTVNGHRALSLISPLRIAGRAEPLGAARIDMTYRHVDQLIKKFETSLKLVVVGLALSCVGLMLGFLRRWVLYPLFYLRRAIEKMTPATMEPNLPESEEDFGKINLALNELVLRMRSEIQGHMSDRMAQAEQEKLWVDKLTRSLLPEKRIFIADKDNLILSDSGNGGVLEGDAKPHLLDVVTDSRFSSLVSDAFQREGEVVHGPVTFEEKNYDAAVLRMPSQYATYVKTVIALTPTA